MSATTCLPAPGLRQAAGKLWNLLKFGGVAAHGRRLSAMRSEDLGQRPLGTNLGCERGSHSHAPVSGGVVARQWNRENESGIDSCPANLCLRRISVMTENGLQPQ